MYEMKYIMYMMKRMEEYLIELIGHDAFEEFSDQIAKEAFVMSIHDMPDGDFKDFCEDIIDQEDFF